MLKDYKESEMEFDLSYVRENILTLPKIHEELQEALTEYQRNLFTIGRFKEHCKDNEMDANLLEISKSLAESHRVYANKIIELRDKYNKQLELYTYSKS